MPIKNVQQPVYELKLHQMELDIQNEEMTYLKFEGDNFDTTVVLEVPQTIA